MGRHAYIILAHDNPHQLGILLDCLADSRNDVFIHIDRKASMRVFEYLMQKKSLFGRLDFIARRTNVRWGHFSQVECEINSFAAVLQTGVDYDHIHLLSGADLPLRPQGAIHDFFDNHPAEEFIDMGNPENDAWDIKRKTEYPFFFAEYIGRKDFFARYIGRNLDRASRRIEKFFGLKVSYDVEIRKGSNWASITPGFAKWIIDHRTCIRKNLRFSWCPDEFLLQSFIIGSPFEKNISPLGNLRKIDWKRGCPYIWRATDLEELLASDAIFARKFSTDVDNSVITKIAETLHPEKIK